MSKRANPHRAIVVFLSVVLSGYAGCASPASRATPAAVAPPTPSAAPSPAAPVVTTVPAPIAPPPVPATPPRVLDIENGPNGISASEWLTAHSVKHTDEILNRIYGCRVVTLGSPPRDGLFCEQGAPMKGSLDSGESLFPLTVWVVDGTSLRVALEVPLIAAPMDPETDDPELSKYLVLEAELTSGGTVIEIRERSEQGARCAAVIARSTAKGYTKIRRVVQIACRSVGRYVWRRDAFRREVPEPRSNTSEL